MSIRAVPIARDVVYCTSTIRKPPFAVWSCDGVARNTNPTVGVGAGVAGDVVARFVVAGKVVVAGVVTSSKRRKVIAFVVATLFAQLWNI